MKTHVLRRLSAFVAATAVALTGALAAMPAAQAASTYTLDQVGGTAKVTSFTYQGTQVKGHYGNNVVIGDYVIPADGVGLDRIMMGVEFSVPLSQLGNGDKVTIPLLAPPRGKVIFFTWYGCSAQDLYLTDSTGTDVKVARMSCSGDTYSGYDLQLSFYDGVAKFNKLDVTTSILTSLQSDASLLEAADIEYDETKLFVGIGTHKFFYQKEPYTQPLGAGFASSWAVSVNLAARFPQGVNAMASTWLYRPVGLANYVLKGDYNNRTPQVNANQYAVYRLDTLSGATIENVKMMLAQPLMSTVDNYFSGTASSVALVDERTSMFTKKTLPQDVLLADFAAVENLLAPGEYAIINNTDGTIDVAVNYGPFYNNPRNKYPNNYTYTPNDHDTPASIAQANANINTLSSGGYGSPNWELRFNIRLNNSQYSQGFTAQSWTKIYNQTRLRTDQGYWDANAGTSTGGTVAQSFVAYRANGGSGAVPVNTVGNVGVAVNIAGQGALTRTGYTFAGWNTKADGTGTSYVDKASFKIPAANTTLYAQWTANDVVPSNVTKPAGYVTVTFAKGTNGKSLSGTSSFHVNPTKSVTLTAPSVVPNTGYKFSKWDKAFTNVKFTANTTITAQYTTVTDSVPVTHGYEDKPGSDPNKPAGYVTVTFAKGAHGTLSGTTSYHVNPTKAVTLKAPTVKPATGYKFSKWDKGFANVKFAKDTTITALYVAASASSSSCAADDPSKQEKVYRLYNPGNSEHLFTTDEKEYNLLARYHGWEQEDVAWVGPNSKGSSVGVYRLYNAGLGDHHYTKDVAEAEKLVKEFGWVYDNNKKPLFYSEDNAECLRIDVYRQYNGGLKTGQHHYTADKTEYDKLIDEHGWGPEGTGWYALFLPKE